MTNRQNIEDSRDEVLYSFDQACKCPTAEQVIDWCARYPQYADDIRAFAAVSRDVSAQGDYDEETADASLLARGFSRVLNLLYEAEQSASKPESVESFKQMMDASKTNIPDLARVMDIDRSVLADLTSGRMLPPLGKRFVDALTIFLSVTPDKLHLAIPLALKSGGAILAKSIRTPRATPRPYKDIIRSSHMTKNRQRYWLDGE